MLRTISRTTISSQKIRVFICNIAILQCYMYQSNQGFIVGIFKLQLKYCYVPYCTNDMNSFDYSDGVFFPSLLVSQI